MFVLCVVPSVVGVFFLLFVCGHVHVAKVHNQHKNVRGLIFGNWGVQHVNNRLHRPHFKISNRFRKNSHEKCAKSLEVPFVHLFEVKLSLLSPPISEQ